MKYPTGYLMNAKTGRCHPISFRLGPAPSSSPDDDVQRYKSLGHHTAGFDTIEQAREWVVSYRTDDFEMIDIGTVWEWDGEDVPAMVQWFGRSSEEAA